MGWLSGGDQRLREQDGVGVFDPKRCILSRAHSVLFWDMKMHVGQVGVLKR